nr:MAG TPA: hypothetical protein [Caudoviricetes sp.]
MSFFTKSNPVASIQKLRDRASRMGLLYLEQNAVKGTLTREMLFQVAKALNEHPAELVEMVPDRRRPTRYEKALTGIRNAGLDQFRNNNDRFDN